MNTMIRHFKLNESEIIFTFIRASGKGGQNVNKVSTAVQLRFNVKHSTSLSPLIRTQLLSIAGKKISREGAGSSLLMDTSTLYLLIKAMKANTHVPIAIKIRVEGGGKEKFKREVATVVSEAGTDFLVVHGRHWTEDYKTPCHFADIQFFVDALSIPVIGNGDIACASSLKKMFALGCKGAMISRASVGRPWLIGELIAELNQEHFSLPSLSERGALFIKHIELLITLLGNEKFAILQARKFAKYYARNLPERAAFCSAINTYESLSEIKMITAHYFL